MNDEQFNLLDWIIIAVIIGAIIFILKTALLFGIWGFGVIGAVLGVFGIIRFLEKTSSFISKLLSPITFLVSLITLPFKFIRAKAGPKLRGILDQLYMAILFIAMILAVPLSILGIIYLLDYLS